MEVEQQQIKNQELMLFRTQTETSVFNLEEAKGNYENNLIDIHNLVDTPV